MLPANYHILFFFTSIQGKYLHVDISQIIYSEVISLNNIVSGKLPFLQKLHVLIKDDIGETILMENWIKEILIEGSLLKTHHWRDYKCLYPNFIWY